MKNKLLLYISLPAAVLAVVFYFLSFPSFTNIKNTTEKKLQKLNEEATVDLDSIHKHLHYSSKNDFVNYLAKNYANTFTEKGIAFFIYENDSLQFWTDNHPAVENYMLNVCLEKKIVKLKNGYYQVIRHSQNAYSPFQLYALVLIKNGFAYQNKYLRNSFNPYFGLPHHCDILENKSALKNSFDISDSKNEFLFSIEVKQEHRNEVYSFLSFITLCFTLFLWLYFFKKLIQPEQSIIQFLKWILLLAVAAAILYIYLFKVNGLYLFIYSVNELDAFVAPLYIICLLTLTIWILSVSRSLVNNLGLKKDNIWLFAGYTVLLYTAGYGINFFLRNTFSHPYLSADLADVFFYPSVYVYLSYVCVFMVFLCFSLLSEIAVKFFLFSNAELKKYAGVFLLLGAINACLHHINSQYDVLTAIWPGVFFILIITSKLKITANKFLYGILVCLTISFFGAYLTINLKNRTDYKQRFELAQDLVNPKDEVVENLFTGITKNLLTDNELQKTIVKKDKNTINPEQYILRKYFMGYWERYHISVCLFDSVCNPLVPQATHIYNNNTYFDEMITSKLKPTDCDGLYFNYLLKDKTYYLYKQSLPFAHKPYQLYVVVESKNTADHRGFPDLLLNQSSTTINTEYSYAVYRNNQLQEKQGSYEYPLVINDDVRKVSGYNENGYSHLVYAPNPSSIVIISKNYTYLNDLSATISFLFLGGSTVFLLFSIIAIFIFKKENSLAVKIQHYVSMGVLLLFVPVAISAFVLAKEQTEAQNIDGIKEKIQTVSSYLSNQLLTYDTLSSANKEYTAYLLRQASALFKSDVALFNSNGEYYTAGLPKLFDEGIISKKINPAVYANEINNKTEKEVYNENIGRLNFYSAYRTLSNGNKHKLAIINMPYFSKQNQIQAQLFNYLSALFNIYVLSFMLISIAAALLSNWLTRPLQQLQTQIKKVTLQKNNEPINYSKADEIGLLISSYNSMLIKLQQSAEQLSKSEREGAWKEMARQVAHEIKNPLTPMKLSIQHVERLLDTQPEEGQRQAKKIIPILLEQIDALAHIATEFSNFAQLPTPNFERVDLVSFVKNCLPLYQPNTKINIQFISELNVAYVSADKDQLLRVLNNLVNNAIQAIEDNKRGEIILSLLKENDTYVVSVCDNGTGINEDAKQKIFQPNFSTKSYGTGLGLAMCKRIIEQHNGAIWFESEAKKGATFYFKLNCIS
ncbi:MAG TPA: HAMP domain-containing sensor histidine kinase [Bacteroidia bacterium]|nr:HAMP domain-containing sensor histidine kinase [Bacteroidia bacterium]